MQNKTVLFQNKCRIKLGSSGADEGAQHPKMQVLLGISKKGIEWQIRRLKSAGRLERIGPDKGGRWRVTGEEDDG